MGSACASTVRRSSAGSPCGPSWRCRRPRHFSLRWRPRRRASMSAPQWPGWRPGSISCRSSARSENPRDCGYLPPRRSSPRSPPRREACRAGGRGLGAVRTVLPVTRRMRCVRLRPPVFCPLAPTAQTPPGNFATAASTPGARSALLLTVVQLLPFQWARRGVCVVPDDQADCPGVAGGYRCHAHESGGRGRADVRTDCWGARPPLWAASVDLKSPSPVMRIWAIWAGRRRAA